MQATQRTNTTQANETATHDPVLTSEDEAFLQQVMSQPENGEPGATTTIATESDSGDVVATGSNPIAQDTQRVEEFGKKLGEQQRRGTEASEEAGSKDREDSEKSRREGETAPAAEKKKKRWSLNWPWKKEGKEKKEQKSNEANTDDKPADNDVSKETPNVESQAQPQPETQAEAAPAPGEDDDMAEILEQLNLAAENNRVFSASDEMQELLRKFKLIFKDLVNGVPTAYHDLEMLLKNGNKQLQDTYGQLPSFLQRLIEKLPERWTESLAPEVLAAASEKAAKSGMNAENVGKAASAANKMGLQVPSLKELVGKPAAIVGMLRSIVAFLKARFPAVVGVNILWSLALSILLFVLWYCHKRGKEVRLENERIVTEQEIEKMNEQLSTSEDRPIRATETLTTTAPRGASADAIRDGVREIEQTRDISRIGSAAAEQEEAGRNENENTTVDENEKPAEAPTRSKSKFGMWSRSASKRTSKVEPYPGT